MATARRLVDKALAASRGKPLPTRIRRLVGLLARKGYPAPIAYRVVREAIEQEASMRRVPGWTSMTWPLSLSTARTSSG